MKATKIDKKEDSSTSNSFQKPLLDPKDGINNNLYQF
jgi:hypothetical protein